MKGTCTAFHKVHRKTTHSSYNKYNELKNSNFFNYHKFYTFPCKTLYNLLPFPFTLYLHIKYIQII